MLEDEELDPPEEEDDEDEDDEEEDEDDEDDEELDEELDEDEALGGMEGEPTLMDRLVDDPLEPVGGGIVPTGGSEDSCATVSMSQGNFWWMPFCFSVSWNPSRVLPDLSLRWMPGTTSEANRDMR